MFLVTPLVLLGPPGSGKGTQASQLAASKPGWIHISTGDLFRAEVKSESELGKRVSGILASGQLVSDDVTYEVFRSQTDKILKEKNPSVVMFDGYPRTGPQAVSFLQYLQGSGRFSQPVVVEFEISADEIVARLSNRLVNPRNGKVYHRLSNPPKKEGLCDVDGGPLEQRADDQPEVIRKRYKIYADARDAILASLKSVGRNIILDATQAPSQVQARLLSQI